MYWALYLSINDTNLFPTTATFAVLFIQFIPRAHKNGQLEYERVTPIEAPIVQSKSLNCTKNRTPGHVLSKNVSCLPNMPSMY